MSHLFTTRLTGEPIRPGDPHLVPQFTAVSAAAVRGVINARRARDDFFDPKLFSDPAWEILLELYATDLEHLRHSIGTLSAKLPIPATTTLRWIVTLDAGGLVVRRDDLRDARRVFVALSPRGRDAMASYFESRLTGI